LIFSTFYLIFELGLSINEIDALPLHEDFLHVGVEPWYLDEVMYSKPFGFGELELVQEVVSECDD
jgi:hypothetical protein